MCHSSHEGSKREKEKLGASNHGSYDTSTLGPTFSIQSLLAQPPRHHHPNNKSNKQKVVFTHYIPAVAVPLGITMESRDGTNNKANNQPNPRPITSHTSES